MQQEKKRVQGVAVVESSPYGQSELGRGKDCVELTAQHAVFIQRSRAYSRSEHEHFLRSIFRKNHLGDKVQKCAATGVHRGSWYSAFSRDDVRAGRCPRRLMPGGVGFQLPRPISRPFAPCTVVKRARVVSHTEAVPVTIYVPAPCGPPAKKVRKLEVETVSVSPPIHLIEIVDDTPALTPPMEVASPSTPARPEYEDYFAVDPPTPGAADDKPGLEAAKVFVTAVTARLQGHG